MRFLVIQNATYFNLKINVKQKPQSCLYVEPTFSLNTFWKEKTKQTEQKRNKWSMRGTLLVFVLTENSLILEMLRADEGELEVRKILSFKENFMGKNNKRLN